MRAPLCLVAVCLILVACEPPPSSSTPPEPDDAEAPAAGDLSADAPLDESVAGDSGIESSTNPLIELLEQDIAYGEGTDGNLVGFLAVPEDAAEPLPGILVIHEWWGLTAEIRDAARRLAREGYVVLAVDLYGGRTAQTVPQAQALLRDIVAAPEQVRANIRQGYEYLERYALAPRVGSIGWDLGARWSLQTALMYPDALDAAVLFYGTVETDEALLATLNMPILGFFGELDASVPIGSVQTFRNELRRLGKPADIRIYADIGHGFFFPGSPGYDAIAADDSWLRVVAQLAAALKN